MCCTSVANSYKNSLQTANNDRVILYMELVDSEEASHI